MATFTRIHEPGDDPTRPLRMEIAPMHLGQRLFAERQRLAIPIDDVAIALQTDRQTVHRVEGLASIPPALAQRLRKYLASLEAMPTPQAKTVPQPAAQVTDPIDDATDDAPPDTAPPVAPPDDLANDAAFGAWIKAQRKARGWTLKALGERAGLSLSTAHSVESGRRCERPTRKAIIDAFAAHPTDAPIPVPEPAPQSVAAPAPDVADTPDLDDIDGLAAVTQALLKEDTRPDPPPMQAPKHFTNVNLRMAMPRGDYALTVLLDKMPAYRDAVGHQREWFAAFEKLTALAQATATQDQEAE